MVLRIGSTSANETEDKGRLWFCGSYIVARGKGKIKKKLKIDDAHVNTNIYSYMCIYLHIADSPRL